MRRIVVLTSILAAGMALAGRAAPAAAGTYREMGDAPPLLPGQPTVASSPLTLIHGTLFDSTDVDLFRIVITNPAAFSATYLGGAAVDVQFFLFSLGGNGISHDDDTPPGAILGSTLVSIPPPGPGMYALAISAFNVDPVGAGLLPIWQSNPVNVERAPDGPGAPGPLTSWSGIGVTSGDYWIQLTGCDAFTPTTQTGMWFESGDAPLTPPGQNTLGSGALSYIYGALPDTLDADAYCIDITDPLNFSATVAALPETDTQLFLLTAGGNGVVFDDDDPAGGTSHSRISSALIPGPGYYTLMISSFDRDVLGALGQPMWVDTLFSEERPPDGAGAPGPFMGWIDGGKGTGPYGIVLTGATFCNSTTAVPPVARGGGLSIDAFPNPASPAIRIECMLPAAGPVRVGVYDLAGRRVRLLHDGPSPGRALALTWDGHDDRGLALAPKVYVIRLEFAGQVLARRVVLLK